MGDMIRVYSYISLHICIKCSLLEVSLQTPPDQMGHYQLILHTTHVHAETEKLGSIVTHYRSNDFVINGNCPHRSVQTEQDVLLMYSLYLYTQHRIRTP